MRKGAKIVGALVLLAVVAFLGLRYLTPTTSDPIPVVTEQSTSESISDDSEAGTAEAGVAAEDEAAAVPETAETVAPEATAALPTGDMKIELTIAGQAEGVIVIDLLEDIAPLHAERIASLAETGAYDQVVFHRVIEGFMAQTGDVEFGKLGGNIRLAGQGGSDLEDLTAEFSDVPFDRGVVGMARSQSPDSANSQFFIMFQEGYFLNGQYTVVGKVTEGMDIVDKIKLGTGANGAVTGEADYIASVKAIR